MNATPESHAHAETTDQGGAPDGKAGANGPTATPPAAPASSTAGILPFEDFDLDDIELIESKVFA